MMTALLQELRPYGMGEGQPQEWIAATAWRSPQPDWTPNLRNVDRMELRFGRYRLVPGARLLLRDGEPVELGGRAYDLLHVLVSRRGQIVEKDEIVRHVWPNTFVQEGNLRFQVAALRRILGDDNGLIKTIAGRGYLFAAEFEPA